VTLSNNEFDGVTSWSASCDGHHYWTLFFLGTNDAITMVSNYIHNTSGRGPKVGDAQNLRLHAVNNFWEDCSGHAFDNEHGANVLAEGNVFQNVKQPLLPSKTPGNVFVANAAVNKQCTAYIGRRCEGNIFSLSGQFDGSSVDVLNDFAHISVVSAIPASSVAAKVKTSAGIGKI